MPLKVYYLDDEPALGETFEEAFASPDVVVTTFTEPKIAVDAIGRDPPDLFFVDYRMPGTTGDRIAQQLDPTIPKYLISGDPDIETVYKFVGVIAKPYSIEAIDAILAAMLKANHRNSA